MEKVVFFFFFYPHQCVILKNWLLQIYLWICSQWSVLQCWRCHTASYSGRSQPSLSFLDWIIIIFELFLHLIAEEDYADLQLDLSYCRRCKKNPEIFQLAWFNSLWAFSTSLQKKKKILAVLQLDVSYCRHQWKMPVIFELSWGKSRWAFLIQ